jgi:hypothetical protein
LINHNRPDRAGRRGSQDLLAQFVVGIRVIHERFFTAQPEDSRREWDALRVSLASIQINYNSHISVPPFPDDFRLPP